MKKFEYKIFPFGIGLLGNLHNAESELNKLGNNGWEVFTEKIIDNYHVFFLKREITD